MIMATASQMAIIEYEAIQNHGISEIRLIENAALALQRSALPMLDGKKRVVVFCGRGKNGADGLALTRLLLLEGLIATAYLVSPREKVAEVTLEMERRLVEVGGALVDFDPDDAELAARCDEADLFVDAMFGTGFHGALSGHPEAAARRMNESCAPVLSADVPSGVQSDDGEIEGVAVQADRTVTFTLFKPALLLAQAQCGVIEEVDIGIPRTCIKSQKFLFHAVEESYLAKRIPRRSRAAHKGKFGKVLLVVGSKRYSGAARLSIQAAVRTGVGIVYAGVPESIYPIVASACPEAIVFPLPEDGEGRMTAQAIPELYEVASTCDAMLIGPGLGRSAELDDLVARLISASAIPVVLDADGINAFAENIHVPRSCPLILTPHEGEFKRLSGSLQQGRWIESRSFARRHECVLVLKGYHTITAYPDGTAYVNTTGNPGMAKGGSGDVLAGVMVSLIGQKINGAPQLAAYIHGLAGDDCAAQIGEYGMTPSDMVAALPKTLRPFQP